MATATIQRVRLSRDDLLDEYVVLRRAGCDWEQCAQRLGMSYVAFERALNRARGDGDPRARRLGEVGYPVSTETETAPDRTDAACTGHPEPWLWDDELDQVTETPWQRYQRRDRAAGICSGCPLWHQCDGRVTPEPPPCAQCGKPFTPANPLHRYCTIKCREHRKWLARRPRTPQPPPTHCPCGVKLTEQQRNRRRFYHSDECHRRHRNADSARRKAISRARRRANSKVA